MNNIQLQKKIMRRVYVVWVLRVLTGSVALRIYALGVFAALSPIYVSFRDVASNFMGVYKTSFSSFAYSAFANTEIVTLILIAGTFIILSLLVKDIVFTRKYFSSIV